MDKQEQIRFVNELVNGLRASIIGSIESNKVPDNWDGFELRQYVADWARENIAWTDMKRGRKMAYNNTRIINNL